MKIRSIRLAVLCIFALGAAFAQETETFNGHQVRARQVLVRTSGDAALPGRLAQFLDADESRQLNRNLNLHVLHSRSMGIAALINRLRNEPGVLYAEPDYVVSAVAVTPNETLFSQQWSFAKIGAPSAWSVSTGGAAAVAGVVDTGIDYAHPDLAANVWSAPSSFTVTLSWGTLTCPAGSHGYNAIARSCNPMDDNGHGTHVAGTIGAVGNNAQGVAGLNWQARMMGLKFLDSTGNGYVSNAIDAIEFAYQAKTVLGSAANVRVLSNSWAGDQASQALLDEINRVNTGNMLFVAAAGNNARNNDVTPIYPASFAVANVLSVAATTNTDARASFSNYGKTSVHLAAPGVNILSTWPGSGYSSASGTSMATPHVSGAALLMLSVCSVSTAQLKSLILANVDLVPGLANITISGGRLNVDRAIRACATPAPTSDTASFVKLDTSTRGAWKGVYGSDGVNILGDTANYPAYATVTPSGNNGHTWAASTADPRGMQKVAGLDGIAACWYSGSTFNIDVRFNDTATHQLAFYMLDWDFSNRSQRVEILSSTGAVLDTRTASGFTNGQYLVWSLTGHVVLRITSLNSATNAVVSGLLFGGSGAAPPAPTPDAATFVKVDTTTQGSWKGVYGLDGSTILGNSTNYPAYVTATPSGHNSYTWVASTADPRAMQKAAGSDRIAACWYSGGVFNIDLLFSDGAAHSVALYLLDWDAGGRSQRVEILGSTGTVLDTRTVSGFGNGQYLVWNLSGHVVIRVTNLNGSSNAVVSGLLFGGAGAPPPPPTPGTASFVKVDTTTQGSWKGVYGSGGSNILGDSTNYPAYVTATPSGHNSYTWTGSTADVRGMQKFSGSDRIAACWYSGGGFTIDLVFNDSATHQLALYLLDWDAGGRSQRVEILSGAGTVLDTRTVSGFGNGQYLVWNLTGHVTVRVTNLNGSSNAVVSGLLFGL